ncbi:uncharacterized protein MP3633_1802 [Marinomonas primoryensis]|uniref:Uncharacterized protein n=1 Tax=Marinomonas primoryensis TaxID=178399 RepID=A0A859D183_9GAMM|nr:uncharacterized protein MP3633_1802 [Marinomonas primoryensis]
MDLRDKMRKIHHSKQCNKMKNYYSRSNYNAYYMSIFLKKILTSSGL